MFDCFKNCWSALALRTPYTSSAPHRNAERGNGVTEILGSTLESLSPAASIPTKLAQTGISLFSIFRTDVHASEKIVHALQAGISAAQMGISIALLFQGTLCDDSHGTQLCKAAFLLQLLYKGTLIAGWAPSEFTKDPYSEGITLQVTEDTVDRAVNAV